MKVRVVVPEVVCLEVINKYREELKAFVESLERLVSSSGRLQLYVTLPSLDIATAVERYEAWFCGRLEASKVTIAPIPSVSHDELLRAVLARRPPFSADDRGYRDALIWECLRSLAGDLHFVSADSVFYQSKEGCELHSDLPPPHRQASVTGYRGVAQFLDAHLDQSARAVRQIRRALDETSLGATVEKEIVRLVLEEDVFGLDGRGDVRHDLEIPELPPDVESTTVDAAEVESPVVVCSAQPIDGNRCLVELEAKTLLRLSFYARKADAYSWKAEHRRLITDPDWNEHMVECELETVRDVSSDAEWSTTEEKLTELYLSGIW